MTSPAVFWFGLLATLFWSAIMVDPPFDMPLPFPASTQKVVSIPRENLPVRQMPWNGTLAPNTILQDKAVRIAEGWVKGSESVAVTTAAWGSDAPTHLIMLDKFGEVWIADQGADGEYRLQSTKEPYARLGQGRPLGFHLDGNDDLIICDSTKGLLKLERESRKIVQLAAYVSEDSPIDPGSGINYANDLDISRSGVVYFTASQDIPIGRAPEGYFDTYHSYLLGLFSGSATGRLLAYYPHNGSTHVLTGGFMYTNGVALSEDESYVAFVETNRQRVLRYWLKGPQAGSAEVLVDALPGAPDGISRSMDGNFWVTLVAPRSPAFAVLKYKLIRFFISHLPMSLLQRFSKGWGMVLKVSPAGEVLSSMMDPKGKRVAYVSAVTETADKLFLGNLVHDYVSYILKADLQ